jgi:actin-related protein
MKFSDILRAIAKAEILDSMEQNLDQSSTLTMVPDTAEKIQDVETLQPADTENAESPEDLFLPPLQMKMELLKKAVGVANVYDDGAPTDQVEETEQQDDMSDERQDIVNRIKQLSGIPIAAVQELSNDEVLDN